MIEKKKVLLVFSIYLVSLYPNSDQLKFQFNQIMLVTDFDRSKI